MGSPDECFLLLGEASDHARDAAEFLRELAHHGDAWVAAATIFLAVATFAMVRETKRLAESTTDEVAAVKAQAEAARDEVAITRDAFQASLRPLLVDVATGDPATEEVAYGNARYTVARPAPHTDETADFL